MSKTSEKTSISNFNSGRLTLPLEMKWKPKEDITTYELAFCMKYLCRNTSVMPYEIDVNAKYLRHFEINDPNKE